MTIDKFGRHLHRHRQVEPESDLDQEKPLLVDTAAGLYYETVLYIFGSSRLDKNRCYHLLHSKDSKCIVRTFAGRISDIQLPEDVQLLLNGKPQSSHIIGTILKPEDILQFKYMKTSNIDIPPLYSKIHIKIPVIVET